MNNRDIEISDFKPMRLIIFCWYVIILNFIEILYGFRHFGRGNTAGPTIGISTHPEVEAVELIPLNEDSLSIMWVIRIVFAIVSIFIVANILRGRRWAKFVFIISELMVLTFLLLTDISIFRIVITLLNLLILWFVFKKER